jgi:hypothetical protein
MSPPNECDTTCGTSGWLGARPRRARAGRPAAAIGGQPRAAGSRGRGAGTRLAGRAGAHRAEAVAESWARCSRAPHHGRRRQGGEEAGDVRCAGQPTWRLGPSAHQASCCVLASGVLASRRSPRVQISTQMPAAAPARASSSCPTCVRAQRARHRCGQGVAAALAPQAERVAAVAS